MSSEHMFYLLLVGGFVIWSLTHYWVWAIIFIIAGLACLFSIIASVIHFQILAALFFTFLAVALGVLHGFVATFFD